MYNIVIGFPLLKAYICLNQRKINILIKIINNSGKRQNHATNKPLLLILSRKLKSDLHVDPNFKVDYI